MFSFCFWASFGCLMFFSCSFTFGDLSASFVSVLFYMLSVSYSEYQRYQRMSVPISKNLKKAGFSDDEVIFM